MNTICELPLSPAPLVLDYLLNSSNTASFVNGSYSPQDLLNRAKEKSFTQEQRNLLTRVLTKQNQQASEASKAQIASLSQANTFSVVTGHQLCAAGGPLFLFHKLLSTIRVCEELNASQSEFHFVPIYWMATEDHDIAEINHFFWGDLKYHLTEDYAGAAGFLPTTSMQHLLANELNEKFRRKEVQAFFQKHYAHATFHEATRGWVNELFGARGLVVVDGNNHELKASFAPIMAREITEQFVHRTVNHTNHLLHQAGYETAVTPRELNLFYLHENKRVRLVKENNHVRALDGSYEGGVAETLDHLNAHPERFSPNVLLRPVYEEFILPSVCYIGGPGELAYWMQLKATFETAEVPMPALMHRFSALWLKPKDVETMKKNDLPLEAFQHTAEDAKKEIIAKLAPRETQHERNVNSQLFESLRHYAKSFDDTLIPFLNAEEKRQQDQWKAIEGKFKKSLKQKEEVRLNQIEKVFQFARPENQPQERIHSLMYALEIFGFDALLSVWDKEDPFTPAWRIMEIAPSTFAE